MRIAISLVLLVAAAARAEEPDPKVQRARAHMTSAIAYYDEARYEDAAREIQAAYAIKPLPELQYNLAQCDERLGKLDEAVTAYKAYVAGKPDADDRAAIEARIKNLEERVHDSKAAAPPPAPEKVVFKTLVVYREAPPKPGRGARWAGAGLGVLALAAVAASVTFGVLASHNADTVTKLANPNDPTSYDGAASAAADSGRLDVTLAWVSAGVAVLAAAGAVGLFILGSRIDREAPAVALAPSLSPSGGGLAVAGRF